jgi:hypothetical protein
VVELIGITINDTILVALISGLIGFIPTYLGAIVKFRKDLEAEYDKDLRNKRIVVYKDLWKRLQPLAKYSPPEPITYNKIKEILSSLRQWYFEIGGLFMSENSRVSYFTLMDKLKETTEHFTQRDDNLLPEEIYEDIRQLSSNLRTYLSKDVGTRQRPRLNYD